MRGCWDAKGKLIELEAKSSPDPEQFRSCVERTLWYIKEKRAQKILADISKMGDISSEDLVWAETDWLPRCLKAGARFFATVLPKSLASHLSLDKMVERVDPSTTGHVRRFFADAASAREWLALCSIARCFVLGSYWCSVPRFGVFRRNRRYRHG